jgi:hypothetical protein
MDFDVSLLANYGALGTVLTYFIIKDHTTMKDFRNTMQELKELILVMKAERKGGSST